MQRNRCVWCQQQFQDERDKKLHVSLLGAPGEFHRACFEEYVASPSFDAADSRPTRRAAHGAS